MLLYGAEAMTPEELKNRSLRVTHPVEDIPSDDKDLMELDILQAFGKPREVSTRNHKVERQEDRQKEHRSRRLGPKKEAKCRNLRQTSTQVGRAIPSNQEQQARVISPVRRRRQ